MAEQTGQRGYLLWLDKVNATALHMLFRLHLGMIQFSFAGLVEDRRTP